MIVLGQYPEVTLSEACDAGDDAQLLRTGADPKAVRERHRGEVRLNTDNTFELIARGWHQRQKAKWTGEHAVTMLRRLESTCSRSSARGPSPRSIPRSI